MFVISKKSRRQAGQVIACDLLRVVARCVTRINESKRLAARLRAAFAEFGA